jgi:3-phosphoshikimate 1-carboxyvinyltransferase
VRQGKLKGIQANLSDCIDLLPTVAVLAALADGKSELSGIERARIKESNRIAAIKEGLQKLDIAVTEDRDRLTIIGLKTPVKKEETTLEETSAEKIGDKEEPVEKGPAVINSYSDHRIAMAFSVLGAAEGNVIIEGAECVAKTYPGFWEAFKSVGGEMAENG